MKLSGIVIWYNPQENDILNINSYIGYVDKLYVVDNSSKNNIDFVKKIKDTYKVEYIPNMKNLGIAKALNIGCEKAINEKYKWILTMDQDSKFLPEIINKYMELFLRKNSDEIGIIAPRYSINGAVIPKNKYSVITSGSILNLNIYNQIGGFLEKLFIDEVDHEICFRILENNYKILQFDEIILEHKLGNTEIKKIFNKTFSVNNHSALRRYYIVRNKLYVKKLHPEFTKEYYKDILKLIVKIILFEKNKFQNIKYILHGIRDYKKNIMGKYKEVK